MGASIVVPRELSLIAAGRAGAFAGSPGQVWVRILAEMPLNEGERAALLHDWNRPYDAPVTARRPLLFDDTLRDGLQNPSVSDPGVDGKLELLSAMSGLGIEFAGIGMPSASARHFEEARALCAGISAQRLSVTPVCAARALDSDVERALRLVERVGLPIELHIFLATSTIRQHAEGWQSAQLLERVSSTVATAHGAGLPVAFVAEDATRSEPRVLAQLVRVALGAGAGRICLCDTVGAVAPAGVRRLVEHTRRAIEAAGASAGIDWHGHNDRGLALSNALAAAAAGASRIHATVLGVGERVGNTPLELLLLNMDLEGARALECPKALVEYSQRAAALLGWPIPANYPLVGADAFRTATGVHAAAIAKAEALGEPWLAEHVYSALAAGDFGREQRIEIGPASGGWNVRHWLTRHGYETRPELVERILARAKAMRGVVPDALLHRWVVDAGPPRGA